MNELQWSPLSSSNNPQGSQQTLVFLPVKSRRNVVNILLPTPRKEIFFLTNSDQHDIWQVNVYIGGGYLFTARSSEESYSILLLVLVLARTPEVTACGDISPFKMKHTGKTNSERPGHGLEEK